MEHKEKQKPTFRFDELLENRCINYLKRYCIGKKNATPHKLLATIIGTNPRTVRALLNHLVIEHEIPIGSTSDSGIFYISTQEEMKQAYLELMSRVEKIIERAFALKQAYYKSINNRPRLF